MQMQAGFKVKPFGIDKLKIIDWIYSLMIFKDKRLGEKMATLKLPEHLLTLMQYHFMNSFLHLRVNKIFEEAFKTADELYVSTVREWTTGSSRWTAT
jgi:hypothetical protein